MWWIIITIIVCTYFIIRVIKQQSPVEQQKKAAKEVALIEAQNEFWNEKIMHREPDLIESSVLDELRADFVRMEESYSRLKEMEKDMNKRLEYATDLRDYGEAVFHLKMAWCIFQTDLSNEAVDNYGEKQSEYIPQKTRIEEKFARSLKRE